ncbi:LysE family translocator [Dickeya chrysanthemi]|uniref:LysE family transporter n=1 Tax=Dickeya chrysanthemi TaxID=556 RepID=A0ABU8JGE0_DICCH|nr:LysE family transporter [Dickeya chrysanthemi]MBX9445381.1 LysE family transporter [Dickeya chrysanthemi]MCA7006942.1 LysE family transporter [Dickeya chrysanthemi]
MSYEYLKVILYIALFLIIPGPTNTLLLCASYTQGVIKSARLVLSEWAGYLLAVTAWGLLFTYLVRYGGLMLGVIKLLSAFYVIYLAVKVWRFSFHQINGTITSGTVFITTLLNPKAFLFADSIIPPSAFIYQASYIHAMVSLLLALFPVSFIWLYFGTLMRLSNTSQRRVKPMLFYRGASLIISLFAASMFYQSASMIL